MSFLILGAAIDLKRVEENVSSLTAARVSNKMENGKWAFYVHHRSHWCLQQERAVFGAIWRIIRVQWKTLKGCMLEVLSINRSLALKWHRQIGVSKRTNYGIVLKFKNTFLKSSFAFTEKLSRVEFSYGPCSAIAALSFPNTHPHTHKYSEPSLPHYPVNIHPRAVSGYIQWTYTDISWSLRVQSLH